MLTIILNYIGAVVVVLFGAACLIAPTAVAEWVSFRLEGERGRAEFRTGFGGFFLAPGLFA
ncbi:MAG: hypothetical protein ACFB51_19595 [Anaerolineae bacterium]